MAVLVVRVASEIVSLFVPVVTTAVEIAVETAIVRKRDAESRTRVD